MHGIDALKMGETNQRIFLLNAWEETELFNEEEKVTVELGEKLTVVADNRIVDDLYARLEKF